MSGDIGTYAAADLGIDKATVQQYSHEGDSYAVPSAMTEGQYSAWSKHGGAYTEADMDTGSSHKTNVAQSIKDAHPDKTPEQHKSILEHVRDTIFGSPNPKSSGPFGSSPIGQLGEAVSKIFGG